MKPPSTIRVGVYDVKIEINNNLKELERYGDFAENYGDYTIRVGKTSKVATADTLLHEITHAIVRIYNIEIEDTDEEKLVTSLGTAYAQVYRDSPELLAYIGWLLK